MRCRHGIVRRALVVSRGRYVYARSGGGVRNRFVGLQKFVGDLNGALLAKNNADGLASCVIERFSAVAALMLGQNAVQIRRAHARQGAYIMSKGPKALGRLGRYGSRRVIVCISNSQYTGCLKPKTDQSIKKNKSGSHVCNGVSFTCPRLLASHEGAACQPRRRHIRQ